MALNLSPETGVKLTKKDKSHVLKKMKQGWKATCLIPDYIFDSEGNIQIGLDKNRRNIKTVKILNDGIHIENALKSKTLRVKWEKITSITKSKEIFESSSNFSAYLNSVIWLVLGKSEHCVSFKKKSGKNYWI